MRTSPPTSASRRREGFSLLEILVVLAIFALSAALIMPSTSRMLDQATSHAVFFEFQEQVSNLRREANRTGVDIRLTEPGAAVRPEPDIAQPTAARRVPAVDRPRTLLLREPWSYTLAPNLDIAAGGVCSTATANLLNAGRVVMTLRSSDGDCRFIRLQTTEAPPRAPASR
ncbi:prepilin-type N-terminal cleavage/methylation domain-containing protein [Pseudomonas sp. ODNR1LW]|nr:prepilin-type N-terminal cleavage/methylation domain-containing protein [Pseudomonas sp. ODNR1LW]